MHVQVVGFLRDIVHGVIKDVLHPYWFRGWNGRTGLGGLDPLAILINVPHLRFCGDGDVVACLL